MNDIHDLRIGNGLRAAREARGMKQEQLASLLGVTDGAVSHWETGRTVPGAPARRLISFVLNVPLDVIDSWFERREAA